MIDNVFVLNTGRCGSRTLALACRQMTNYSVGHEFRSKDIKNRLDYPSQHIEIDNRLSFFLGSLDFKYGDRPLYVHLYRNTEATARSFLRQAPIRPPGIMAGFIESILRQGKRSRINNLDAAKLYVQSTNANIEAFLWNKTKVIRMDIDDPHNTFNLLWNYLGVGGDRDKAHVILSQRNNEIIPAFTARRLE